MDTTRSIQVTDSTLLVIQCSGGKWQPTRSTTGASILGDLSPDTAARLVAQRRRLRDWAHVDERVVVPAIDRYSKGILYEAAAPHLRNAVNKGLDVLILSGGYGVLRATEPIGNYDALFKWSDWRSVLPDCLVEYCNKHSITTVVGLAPVSNDYAKAIRETDWVSGGVRSTFLLTPDLRGQGGALRKVPQAIGEAVVALLGPGLSTTWSSSSGARMDVAVLTRQRRPIRYR